MKEHLLQEVMLYERVCQVHSLAETTLLSFSRNRFETNLFVTESENGAETMIRVDGRKKEKGERTKKKNERVSPLVSPPCISCRTASSHSWMILRDFVSISLTQSATSRHDDDRHHGYQRADNAVGPRP